jgi:hypothetical protein
MLHERTPSGVRFVLRGRIAVDGDAGHLGGRAMRDELPSER